MAVRFALALLCMLLLVPAGAQAAVTFGADLGQTPTVTHGCCDDSLDSPTAPFTGVLVHWALRTQTASVSVQPAVYRGASTTPVVASGAIDTTVPLTTADLRLSMRAGDRLGVHAAGATMPEADRSGEPLVSGVIEPDADADGWGDESQDACPAEAALHVAPCHADVALTMTGPAFGVVERDTPYDVTVANRGPSAAAGVTVTDVIPSGARFVRADGAATCTPGATLHCALPPIAPGASGVLTIVLAGTAEGASFHHAVSVTTTSTDATPGDHSAAVDTLVTGASVAPPPLTLAGAACANPSFGGRDDDVLLGSGFGDRLYGRQGRDLLRGRAGNDCLFGGEGADVLDGDGGNDQLFPGTGRDRVWGGAGNDVVSTRDGSRDVIDCGAGLDRVTADRRDHLRGCERVSRR
jgi:hypothetical protein